MVYPLFCGVFKCCYNIFYSMYRLFYWFATVSVYRVIHICQFLGRKFGRQAVVLIVQKLHSGGSVPLPAPRAQRRLREDAEERGRSCWAVPSRLDRALRTRHLQAPRRPGRAAGSLQAVICCLVNLHSNSVRQAGDTAVIKQRRNLRTRDIVNLPR